MTYRGGVRPTREPRIPAFLATGAVLGALVFLLIDRLGPQGGPFTESSTTGYMLVVGLALGGGEHVVPLALARRDVEHCRNAAFARARQHRLLLLR